MTREELLREAVHEHYNCNGKYGCSDRDYCCFCDGMNTAHDCNEECFADEFGEGFLSGWNACLKHLAEIPLDESINEIVENIKR